MCDDSRLLALVNPPIFLNDFRSPYLAIPQLLGYLRENDVDPESVHLADTNMDFWQVAKTPKFISHLVERNSLALSNASVDEIDDLHFERLLLKFLLERPQSISRPDVINLFAGSILGWYYSFIKKTWGASQHRIWAFPFYLRLSDNRWKMRRPPSRQLFLVFLLPNNTTPLC